MPTTPSGLQYEDTVVGDGPSALAEFEPAMLAAAQASMHAARHDGARIFPDADAFAAAPDQSIDYAVMEKADKVAVVPVSMAWSDVGSWKHGDRSQAISW